MKEKLLVLIILIISIDTYGQQLKYKNELVKSITITSYTRKTFPNNEIIVNQSIHVKTETVIDKYIIKYNSNSENYIATYKRENIVYTPNKIGNYKKRTKEKTLPFKDTVNQIKVEHFLGNLELNNLKTDFNGTGMSHQEFIQLTSGKEILRVIKSKWIRKQVEEDVLKKANLDSIFYGFQSIDTFNLFLRDDFNITRPLNKNKIRESPIDGPIAFDVEIITNKSTYRYRGGTPNPYVRNWYNINESYSSILNFFINTSLIEILPKDFLAIETISNKTLVDRYIEWYLKRRGIIPIRYYID